jgi:hypothetical protein
MHARVNIFQGTAETIGAGIEYVRGNVLPALGGIEGSRGLVSLVNRETGKSMGITLWESEEAMAASADAAKRLREEIASTLGETIEGVETYEVAFFEVRD